jgi:hypothetical protein
VTCRYGGNDKDEKGERSGMRGDNGRQNESRSDNESREYLRAPHATNASTELISVSPPLSAVGRSVSIFEGSSFVRLSACPPLRLRLVPHFRQLK